MSGYVSRSAGWESNAERWYDAIVLGMILCAVTAFLVFCWCAALIVTG